jgi:chromate transporter
LFFGINPIAAIASSAIMGALLLENQGISKDKIPPENNNSNVFVVITLLCFMIILIILYFLDNELFKISFLMFRIDLSAFGGGFASVPLMYHEIVESYSWMDRETFINGIALGQITPGPIVITATFIGYMLRGFTGAIISTISIFLPSFLMVTGIEPYFNRLHSYDIFNKAINGILCSFIGLLASVTITFLLKVEWNYVLISMAIISFIALYKKLDLIWIIIAGILVSIILL